MAARTRRTSLFSQNLGNVAYRDKLKEEIQAYAERLEENQDVTVLLSEPPKCTDISQLPQEKQDFLNSLPDLDSYETEMIEFLGKFSLLQKQLDTIQKKLDNVGNII